MTNNNNLYFVFNEAKKPESPFRLPKFNTFTLTLVTLNQNGNLTKERVFSNDELYPQTMPKYSFQSSKNEMILYSHKLRNQKLIKIKFK